MAFEALHLAVRPERTPIVAACHVGPLVPGKPQPMETVENVGLERQRAACGVGVLQPEDERAAGPPREEVVEQRRARGADVERARRARRDSDADVWGGLHCRSLAIGGGCSASRAGDAVE